MNNNAIANLDWLNITANLDKEGYALLPKLLGVDQARALAAVVADSDVMRKQQSFNSLALEQATQQRHIEVLPNPLTEWRDIFYEMLAPVASRWSEILEGIAARYPPRLNDFLQQNRAVGQHRSLSAVSHLRKGDYQALHRSADEELIFPFQLVFLLSEPDADFTGGEFVMTEQRPRMQSRVMVLPLHLGDIALITVAHRPVKGRKGYYRVNLKHAISRVHSGERIGVELLFHDAI